ncbi:MAG: Hpt domain-containing protein [Deltaproteobacteria bacterium]|nr:Hpt domain-containing protein [Deltaproteobacteria bacterium]
MEDKNSHLINAEQLNALRELSEDDEEDLLSELIDIFFKNSPENLNHIEEAIQDRERERLLKETHKLKGSCANLGSVELKDLCQELEEQSNVIAWSEAQTSLQKIRDSYKRLSTLLEKEWYQKKTKR